MGNKHSKGRSITWAQWARRAWQTAHSALARPMTARQMRAACAGLAVLLALGGLGGGWAARLHADASRLRADTLRLHILAQSDSVYHQTVKLAVRDALLDMAGEVCAGAQSPAQAMQAAAQNLVRFELAAACTAARYGCTQASAQLVRMYFDTRTYGDAALPAGRYTALRIRLGGGGGRNWWCVLYPGLCLAACSGGYDWPGENELVCGDHLLRFKAVELWQRLAAARGDEVLL